MTIHSDGARFGSNVPIWKYNRTKEEVETFTKMNVELRDEFPRYTGARMVDNLVNHAMYCSGHHHSLPFSTIQRVMLGTAEADDVDDEKCAALVQCFMEGSLVTTSE